MCAKSSSSAADALNYMAQWLPENANIIGVLANVNRDFNEAFQKAATDKRLYDALKEYISNDLQDEHGFYLQPESMDEDQVPMLVFILMHEEEEEEDIIVHLFRGPGSSVMFSSEMVDWTHVQINSAEEWVRFSPWASLRFLVDLDAMEFDIN
jgi:hypothetical protein